MTIEIDNMCTILLVKLGDEEIIRDRLIVEEISFMFIE